jgi:hypothetical protein
MLYQLGNAKNNAPITRRRGLRSMGTNTQTMSRRGVLTDADLALLGAEPGLPTLAFSFAAQRPQTIDDVRLEPDQTVAILVDRVLKAHVAERQRPGDRLEGRLRDGDADHVKLPKRARVLMTKVGDHLPPRAVA